MNYKKYIAEFIGTFFLVLVISMITLTKVQSDLQPIAIGFTLMVMIFAAGHISGAHFNPAVSLAFFLRSKLTGMEFLFYAVAQVAGGIAAAVSATLLVSAKLRQIPLPFGDSPVFFGIGQAFAAEIIGAFALVWVVLNVATSKALDGNNFYGLAIGFTQAAMMYTFSGVSGGFFNPAIAAGLSAIQLINYQNIWIYLIASPIGAALAAYAFKFLSAED